MAFASLSVVTDLMLNRPDTLLQDGPHLLTAPELLRSVLVFDGLKFVNSVPKEGTLFLAFKKTHVI
jgi:hypothetical protein